LQKYKTPHDSNIETTIFYSKLTESGILNSNYHNVTEKGSFLSECNSSGPIWECNNNKT